MSVNAATLKLIRDFEGVRFKAYKDIANKWTIGVGHLILSDERELLGRTLTMAEVDTLLQADLAKAERGVDALVKVPLNENQRGALVSFCFNLGVGRLGASTLLELLNGGFYKEAAQQFGRWINAGGAPSKGLIKRRAAEVALFNTPI